MATVEELKAQTAQYAIEHITGKGVHTSIKWFEDSFREYCNVAGKSLLPENGFFFLKDDMDENLKKDPLISEIAQKTPSLRTVDDIEHVRDFIRLNYALESEEISDDYIQQVLFFADPDVPRDIAARGIYKECEKYLSEEEISILPEILGNAIKQIRGINALKL